MQDKYQNGVVQRLVSDLRPGDRVDLCGDIFADPEITSDEGSTHPEFEFEFSIVLATEIESPECTRVDFEDGFSCGFPPDHWVEVDGEQTREIAS